MSDPCLFCHGSGERRLPPDTDRAHHAMHMAYFYQAQLFQAWSTMHGQTKGLQRQRRLIKRLQAENAFLRDELEMERRDDHD